LENNHNTVLVVGGVHWLASHHLDVIAAALRKEHLEGIQVVVKSLGAGFHQPVDGLHCLSLVRHWAVGLGKVASTVTKTICIYQSFIWPNIMFFASS
jgi:hypothetical protein